MYGRILRIQIARKRRRSSGAQGSRVRRAAAPAPPPAAADETGPGGNSEPWPHHPLALLGFYKQYLPADGEPHDIAPSAGAKSPFASHSAVLFRDTALDSLNPGWEPTVHVFEIPAAAAKRLNAALEPEMLALAASGRGLRVSNRGGGYHSEQHLFQRGGAALGRLEALVCAAAAAASRAERQLAAASHSDDDASSLQPSSVGGAPNGERPEDRPVNSWVNVGRAGAYHGLHDHHGSVWSGVYYVSVPPDPPGSTSGGCALLLCFEGNRPHKRGSQEHAHVTTLLFALSPQAHRVQNGHGRRCGAPGGGAAGEEFGEAVWVVQVRERPPGWDLTHAQPLSRDVSS